MGVESMPVDRECGEGSSKAPAGTISRKENSGTVQKQEGGLRQEHQTSTVAVILTYFELLRLGYILWTL